MTYSKIEAALDAAFSRCDRALCALSDRQKQVLLQAFWESMRGSIASSKDNDEEAAGSVNDLNSTNPLSALTQAERDALLAFIQRQERQNQSWKVTLLNDWLAGRDSESVQFIRERYGVQWLDQIQPVHLANYDVGDEVLKLKVSDRIEVTNGLWEWVQESGPCSREWFPCTVISVQETCLEASNALAACREQSTSCIIRFDTGAEYEIQGVYDWNRPNWRWLQP